MNGPYAIVVRGMTKRYGGRRGQPEVVAVDDVSFVVETGTTLGIVGESGSGKSTVARCILGLVPTDSGQVEVLGRDVSGAAAKQLRAWRSDMQIVFQEPFEALDPRMRVRDAVAEPLILHTGMDRAARAARVDELLGLVALAPELAGRFPDQLSGGQQQRVNIMRAIATEPEVVVLDEPTSALDVSVRADVLRLLVDLQRRLALTFLVISHDLPTIRAVTDRVAVMYLGRIVEQGPTSVVLANPVHPYTQYLLGSELSLDPDVKPAHADSRTGARANDRPTGCIFVHRCPVREDRCFDELPPVRETATGHTAACIWAQGPEVASPTDEGAHAAIQQ